MKSLECFVSKMAISQPVDNKNCSGNTALNGLMNKDPGVICDRQVFEQALNPRFFPPPPPYIQNYSNQASMYYPGQPRYEGSGPYSSLPQNFPPQVNQPQNYPQNYPPFYQTQGNNVTPGISGEGTRHPAGAQGHNSAGFRKENRKCFYCGISGHLQKNCFKRRRDNAENAGGNG